MSVAVERKYPSTYPSDAVAILDAMSFSEGDDVKVIGSMSLRSQLYAGDYDADEDVKRSSLFAIDPVVVLALLLTRYLPYETNVVKYLLDVR